MLELIRLQSVNHDLFAQAWQLYEQSFPTDERRTIANQAPLLTYEVYHFNAVLFQDRFVGLILWWKFDTVCFIEHIATSPAIRGKGIGSRIITQFQRNNAEHILLEVDLPKDDISQRRILFYQRLGFQLNQHPYQQPALNEDSQPVDLLLMSYPHAITASQVKGFISTYHPIIYPAIDTQLTT